jgi:voltage-gated sodium channel
MFSAIFIIEMFVKLIGLGFRHYFQDTFNILDCFIVIASIFDIIS